MNPITAAVETASREASAPAGSEPAGARYGGDSTSPVDRFVCREPDRRGCD